MIYTFFSFFFKNDTDDRKKWIQERKKVEHTLKTMGNYPFVLGLSKKKRVRAMSEVLKHRKREIALRIRPSTTATGRKRNSNKKLKKLKHSSTVDRPGTFAASGETRMHKKLVCSSSYSSNQIGMEKTNSLLEGELEGVEPQNMTVLPTSLLKSASAPNTLQESSSQQSLSSQHHVRLGPSLDYEDGDDGGDGDSLLTTLFSILDTNEDGLLTKNDVIVGVTENIEVQSIIHSNNNEQQTTTIFLNKLLTPDLWVDEFDNIVTEDVNGQININEFYSLLNFLK